MSHLQKGGKVMQITKAEIEEIRSLVPRPLPTELDDPNLLLYVTGHGAERIHKLLDQIENSGR